MRIRKRFFSRPVGDLYLKISSLRIMVLRCVFMLIPIPNLHVCFCDILGFLNNTRTWQLIDAFVSALSNNLRGYAKL